LARMLSRAETEGNISSRQVASSVDRGIGLLGFGGADYSLPPPAIASSLAALTRHYHTLVATS
jgi:hypothetical protein